MHFANGWEVMRWIQNNTENLPPRYHNLMGEFYFYKGLIVRLGFPFKRHKTKITEAQIRQKCIIVQYNYGSHMIIKIRGSFLLIAQCGGYCSSHCIYILNSNKKGKEKGTLPSFYDIIWIFDTPIPLVFL